MSKVTSETDPRDIMDCPACDGTGKQKRGLSKRNCHHCGGLGKIASDLGPLARAIMKEN